MSILFSLSSVLQSKLHEHPAILPIDSTAVVRVDNNFWCEILWRAAESVRGRAICDLFLAEAKVCNLNVAFLVEHEVFELQVTVDDALVVEVRQRQ